MFKNKVKRPQNSIPAFNHNYDFFFVVFGIRIQTLHILYIVVIPELVETSHEGTTAMITYLNGNSFLY